MTYFLENIDNETIFTTTIHAGKADFPVVVSHGYKVANSYMLSLMAGKFMGLEDCYIDEDSRCINLKILCCGR